MQHIEQKKQSHYMIFEGVLSIAANIVFFIFKYIIGIATGSIAIIADGWHSLSDCISSLIVIISGFYSKVPADKEHPFGHGRTEIIANFFISIILIYISYTFVKDGVLKFLSRETTIFSASAIFILIGSIVAKEILAQIAFHMGKKVNSMAIISDGHHHRTDSISSVVILIGIIFGRSFWWLDSVLTIIVAVFIFITAIKMLFSTMSIIIGQAPNSEMIENIINLARNIDEVDESSFHHFHLHKYGSHTELTFHIRFPKDTTVYEAHNIVTEFEKKIKKDFGIEATIHIESQKDI